MMDDLLQYIVREANRLGRRGNKVVAWIPPQRATEDYKGYFVIEYGGQKKATDGPE